jgi:hypothetical protein
MNAPAVTAKLVLDIDLLTVGGIDNAENALAIEARGILAYHTQRAVEIEGALNLTAELAPNVELYVSNLIRQADINYFEANPTRSYSYRHPDPDEPLLALCEASPTYVVIRQLRKGVRLLCPIRFSLIGQMTDAERFNRDRNMKSIDRDSVLKVLFESFCLCPDKALDARQFLAATTQFDVFANAARAIRDGKPS